MPRFLIRGILLTTAVVGGITYYKHRQNSEWFDKHAEKHAADTNLNSNNTQILEQAATTTVDSTTPVPTPITNNTNLNPSATIETPAATTLSNKASSSSSSAQAARTTVSTAAPRVTVVAAVPATTEATTRPEEQQQQQPTQSYAQRAKGLLFDENGRIKRRFF
eukprot:GEZU01003317.1.p1 GENE.GEZU01003317.1~~GEZU01003317.1.p1  ORF type:complete len:164 (+),score=55.92 GEZU01003317.1:64-555(+)